MRGLNRFLRDEHGTMTIEFVLWIPLLMAVAIFVLDVTTIYITHTEMWNVARDTARRMVTGAVTTEEQAEAYAANAMNLRQHYNYDIQAIYHDDKDAVRVFIRYAVADMSILAYGSPMRVIGGTMVARVVMRSDPNLPQKDGALDLP